MGAAPIYRGVIGENMETKDRIIACIAVILGFKPADKNGINMEDALDGRLGLDSLDRLDLTLMLEEKFGISLPDRDMGRCQTVADVVALVERVRGEVVA